MVALHAVSLFVHLACLLVYGASSFGGLLLARSLWSAVERGRNEEALSFTKTAALLGRFAQFAAVLTLLSGVGMLASTGFAQWGQLWLYGKVVLFLGLTGYGGAVGGRVGRRLLAVLSQRAASPQAEGASGVTGELAALRSTLATFHLVMPAMLLAVLLLVVIRP